MYLCIDACMDGWMDGCIYVYMCIGPVPLPYRKLSNQTKNHPSNTRNSFVFILTI